MGFSDLALACGSESVVDAVCTAVVGSARTGRVHDAFSDREDTSSDVCYVGDTRKSFSEKDDDSIPHTHHLCRTTPEAPGYSTSCHIATIFLKQIIVFKNFRGKQLSQKSILETKNSSKNFWNK